MSDVKELLDIEEVTEEEITEEVVDRKDLNLQQFMNDMQGIGNQLKDRDLIKPAFLYGDLGVTNYLLWLMLGELMILNSKGEKEDA